jgi:hypothetical protein
MRVKQHIALANDEKFVDMNIKRLKAEDRRFRERMKTEASDVSELMARYALAKGNAKRDRKPLSPIQRSGDQSKSTQSTQEVRQLSVSLAKSQKSNRSNRSTQSLKSNFGRSGTQDIIREFEDVKHI